MENDISKTRESAVALLSGGLDSAVSLAIAAGRYDVGLSLFFDYGQIPAGKEEESSRAFARHYGTAFERIELQWLGHISSSTMTPGGDDTPDYPVEGDPDDQARVSRAVWVENRNGIFVNVAAAFAAAKAATVIITGFNSEEAGAFPDNSGEFVDVINRALAISTGAPVRVESPTLEMQKREVVKRGIELDLPWKHIWSCYRGGERMCGKCESCIRLKNAVGGTHARASVFFEDDR
jgi:7-cyano-7-deazaguanine synthase